MWVWQLQLTLHRITTPGIALQTRHIEHVRRDEETTLHDFSPRRMTDAKLPYILMVEHSALPALLLCFCPLLFLIVRRNSERKSSVFLELQSRFGDKTNRNLGGWSPRWDCKSSRGKLASSPHFHPPVLTQNIRIIGIRYVCANRTYIWGQGGITYVPCVILTRFFPVQQQ